jgi:hypothetical protein
MTFWPIVERELRQRARARATHWGRWAVALVGVLICLPQVLWPGPLAMMASRGKSVFTGLMAGAFAMSCGGCLLTANSIASERREGTLGLLFLTRATVLDVLVGKFGSVGITALCALGALVPVLMLPLLAGGVTGGEGLRMALALVNALILSLAVGMCASTSTYPGSKPARAAVIWMVFILAVPFVEIPLFFFYPSAGRGEPVLLRLCSPLMTLLAADDSVYRSARATYWVSLAAVHGLAWLLFASAGFRLRRLVREADVPAAAPRLRLFARAMAAVPAKPQPIPSGVGPVEWLVRRQRGSAAAVWTATLLMVVFQSAILLLYYFGFTGLHQIAVMFAQIPGVLASAIGAALIAWVASRFFVECKRGGQLELLLTTPAGAQEIVAGQWRALRGLLLGPALVLVVSFLLRSFLPMLLRPQFVTVFWDLFSLVLAVANIVLMLGAICWLGMFFGLKSRWQPSALGWVLLLTKLVPFIIGTVGAGLLLPWIRTLYPVVGFSGAGMPLAYMGASWLPQAVILLLYLIYIRLARQGLHAAFSGAPEQNLKLQTPNSRGTSSLDLLR